MRCGYLQIAQSNYIIVAASEQAWLCERDYISRPWELEIGKDGRDITLFPIKVDNINKLTNNPR